MCGSGVMQSIFGVRCIRSLFRENGCRRHLSGFCVLQCGFRIAHRLSGVISGLLRCAHPGVGCAALTDCFVQCFQCSLKSLISRKLCSLCFCRDLFRVGKDSSGCNKRPGCGLSVRFSCCQNGTCSLYRRLYSGVFLFDQVLQSALSL